MSLTSLMISVLLLGRVLYLLIYFFVFVVCVCVCVFAEIGISGNFLMHILSSSSVDLAVASLTFWLSIEVVSISRIS